MRWLALAFLVALVIAPPVSAQTTEYFDHASYVLAAAPDTVIDFDGLTKGNGVVSGNDFEAAGLILVQRSSHPMNLVDSFAIATGSGTSGNDSVASHPNALSSSFFVNGFDNSKSDDYDFVFQGGAATAGLWIGNVGPGSTRVEFLDASDNVIASEVIDTSHAGIIGNIPAADTRIFYGVTTNQVIARIRTSEIPGDSDGIVYDDVQFSLLPVQVPTMSMAGIAVLATGLLAASLLILSRPTRACS